MAGKIAKNNRTGPKRTQEERIRDRDEIIKLYCQGFSQREIGIRVCEKFYPEHGPSYLTPQTIGNEWRKALDIWKERYAGDIQELKARELSKVDLVETEAWKAWQRSVGTHTVHTEKDSDKDGPSSQTRTEELAGDPRYLTIINQCVERRCKIIGVDAEVKHQVTIKPWSEIIDGLYQERDSDGIKVISK